MPSRYVCTRCANAMKGNRYECTLCMGDSVVDPNVIDTFEYHTQSRLGDFFRSYGHVEITEFRQED